MDNSAEFQLNHSAEGITREGKTKVKVFCTFYNLCLVLLVEEGDTQGEFIGSAPINKKRRISSAAKAWRGYYCCVPLCRSSSGEQFERRRLGLPAVSFHSFPDPKTEKGKLWITKIRRDPGKDFKITKNTKVCSLHFKPQDFLYSELQIESSRSRLKPNAVPSVFAWTTHLSQRTTVTSKIAASLQQRCDLRTDHASSTEVPNCGSHDIDTGTVDAYTATDTLDNRVQELELEVRELKAKRQELELEVKELKDELHRSENNVSELFCLENIMQTDSLIKFYTGFPDFDTLMIFYEEILKDDAEEMRMWKGKDCKDNLDEFKCGRPHKLPLLEQFFVTLVRLRLGLLEVDIANRFGVSQSTVSRTTLTWINLMYHNFKAMERFPLWDVVKKYMPEIFKKEYPNTRIIIDATEFAIERPSSLLNQSSTFSNYKNRNTVKVLVGITPSGAISFVSESYEGSISDRRLVELSGLLQLLEPGDEVMADKGFLIQDLLAPIGVRLNVPPLLQSKLQMPTDDVVVTKKIAQLRVHVERAIGRVKEFRILQAVLPSSMWESINEIIYVCCMLTNFSPPLVC